MSLNNSQLNKNSNMVMVFKGIGYIAFALSLIAFIAALGFTYTFKPEGFAGLALVPVLFIYLAVIVVLALLGAFFFWLSGRAREGVNSQNTNIIKAIMIPLLAFGFLLCVPYIIFPGDSQSKKAWMEVEGHHGEILDNLPAAERPQAAATIAFLLNTVQRMSWKDARAVKLAMYQWYASKGAVPESTRSRNVVKALDQIAKRNSELPIIHLHGVSKPPNNSPLPPSNNQ